MIVAAPRGNEVGFEDLLEQSVDNAPVQTETIILQAASGGERILC